MQNHALIEGGKVINIIVWDGSAATFQPDPGVTAVLVPDGIAVGIGDTYDGQAFARPAPPTPTLPGAQASQIQAMYTAYQAAIAQDVSFTTAAAVTKLFQADANSVANAQAMLAAYKTAVPAGFYWVAKDNTQVPFTLADLQGLAKAMGDQGWAAFQNLQTRKASILAASTITAVQAIAW